MTDLMAVAESREGNLRLLPTDERHKQTAAAVRMLEEQGYLVCHGQVPEHPSVSKKLARYEKIFNSAAVGLIEVDLTAVKRLLETARVDDPLGSAFTDDLVLNVTAANQAAADIHNVASPDELLGPASMTHGWQRVWETAAGLAFDGVSQVFEDKFEVTLEDGEQKIVHITINVAELRALDKVVVSMADVTERVRLERQLDQAQRVETLGRFVSGIVHDFNNMLTVIKSSAEFLAEAVEAHSAAAEDVRSIEEAVDRSSAMISELLRFAGGDDRKVSQTELNAELTQIRALIERLLGSQVRIDFRAIDRDLPVMMTHTAIEQILLNLVVNARDAMPTGGEVAIETDVTTLAQSATVKAGNYAVLRVSDTGIGIRPAHLERIFEPFFTTKQDQGNGLGLATVAGIVQRAGGKVGVTSTPGEGTSFEVLLPLIEHSSR